MQNHGIVVREERWIPEDGKRISANGNEPLGVALCVSHFVCDNRSRKYVFSGQATTYEFSWEKEKDHTLLTDFFIYMNLS
jgi:hypothetical protein